MDLLRLSGLLGQDLSADELSAYGEVKCSNIEFFGTALDILGLCNPDTGKMLANGTAMLRPHTGQEGIKPEGLSVADFTYVPNGGFYGSGYLEAAFGSNSLPAAESLPVILVLDTATGEAMDMDYGINTEKLADGQGNTSGVRLNLQPGFDPAAKKAIVTYNLFPMAEFDL